MSDLGGDAEGWRQWVLLDPSPERTFLASERYNWDCGESFSLRTLEQGDCGISIPFNICVYLEIFEEGDDDIICADTLFLNEFQERWDASFLRKQRFGPSHASGRFGEKLKDGMKHFVSMYPVLTELAKVDTYLPFLSISNLSEEDRIAFE